MNDHTTSLVIGPPTFRGTAAMLRLLIEAGESPARQVAWEEITRWAAMLDNFAAAEKRANDDAAVRFETYGLDREATILVLDHLGIKPEGRDDALALPPIVNAINAMAEAKRAVAGMPAPDEIEAKIEAIYREFALENVHDAGTLEVDENATVSISPDGGAYVQAWVWVSAGEVGLPSEGDDSEARCDNCEENPVNITMEKATIRPGEAPELRLCMACYERIDTTEWSD